MQNLKIVTALRPGIRQMSFLFSVLRMITPGAACSVLLKFEQKLSDEVIVYKYELL